MNKRGYLTSADTYDSDFSIEEIEIQTKDHFIEMDRLMKENIIVDFTDDEFRGMLGYIIGYTSCDSDGRYKDLRESLIEQVKITTGKDLTQCWIWE